MLSSDVMPVGVFVKLGVLYALAWVGLVADFSIFDTSSSTNLLLATVVIIGTAYITLRSRATKNWHDEADAANARLETMKNELVIQRELKHDAIARAAALELKTDLTPVLEHLSAVQKTLVDLLSSQSHDQTLESLNEIKSMMREQNELLAGILKNGGGR